MSNLLRVSVIGPGLRRSDLVVNYAVCYWKDSQEVTLTLTNPEGHSTRIVANREDATLYRVQVTSENSLNLESFTLATVLQDLVDSVWEALPNAGLQPLEGEYHE